METEEFLIFLPIQIQLQQILFSGIPKFAGFKINSAFCRFLKEYQIINTLPKIAGFQSLEHFSKPLTQPTEIPNFVAWKNIMILQCQEF